MRPPAARARNPAASAAAVPVFVPAFWCRRLRRRTLSFARLNALIDALPISVAHAAHRHSISTQLTVSRLSRAQARAAQGQPLPPHLDEQRRLPPNSHHARHGRLQADVGLPHGFRGEY